MKQNMKQFWLYETSCITCKLNEILLIITYINSTSISTNMTKHFDYIFGSDIAILACDTKWNPNIVSHLLTDTEPNTYISFNNALIIATCDVAQTSLSSRKVE